MDRFVAFLLLLLSVRAGQAAQDCYFAAGRLAGSSIIPCVDPSKGITWCCQSGDLCLSDSACWNPKFNVTYQYGCTDETYRDTKHCPQKCNLDVDKSNWIGLIYCSDQTNQWACHHPDTCANCGSMTVWPQAITKLPEVPGQCLGLKHVIGAFAARTKLTPTLSLPAGPGTPTLYFSPTGTGYVPVSSYTPEWVTATTADPSDTITTTRPQATTASDTSTPASEPTSGGGGGGGTAPSTSSQGQTIGIAVGASVGSMTLIAAAAAFFILRRRRTNEQKKQEQTPLNSQEHEHGDNMNDEQQSNMASPPTTAGWPPKSPFSELGVSEEASSKSRPMSELAAGGSGSSAGGMPSNPGSPAPPYNNWAPTMAPTAELAEERGVVYELPTEYYAGPGPAAHSGPSQ